MDNSKAPKASFLLSDADKLSTVLFDPKTNLLAGPGVPEANVKSGGFSRVSSMTDLSGNRFDPQGLGSRRSGSQHGRIVPPVDSRITGPSRACRLAPAIPEDLPVNSKDIGLLSNFLKASVISDKASFLYSNMTIDHEKLSTGFYGVTNKSSEDAITKLDPRDDVLINDPLIFDHIVTHWKREL